MEEAPNISCLKPMGLLSYPNIDERFIQETRYTRTTGHPNLKKRNSTWTLYNIQKLTNSKWIIDLNVKAKTIQLPEEKQNR